MKPKPPQLGQWVLRKIFFDDEEGTSSGDFSEVFLEISETKGHLFALIWYWIQMFMSLFSYVTGKLFWSGIMIKSYFKIALRNIKRQKIYSFINIAGLAIGLTTCLLIFLFIQYELSFDRFYANSDRIFRVVTHEQYPTGMEYSGCTHYPMAEAIRNDIAGVEIATQIFWSLDVLVTCGKNRFAEDHVFFVESYFLDMFKPGWIRGNPANALSDPHSVILTESLAKKYFGDDNPVGKMICIENRLNVKITGVVQDRPSNTSLPYRMLFSSKLLDDFLEDDIRNWNTSYSGSLTLLLISDTRQKSHVENLLEKIKYKYIKPDIANTEFFYLQPFRKMHTDAAYGSYYYVTPKILLWILSGVGFFILILACINFINLSTAQAMRRSKEVGMRKVLGAGRGQLIRQFLGETVVFTFLAIIVAVFCTDLIIPSFNQFLENNIHIQLFSDVFTFIFLGSIYIFVCLFTGLYPAFILVRFKPVETLRNQFQSQKKGSSRLRNGLVVFQFLISQILIIGTFVVAKQVHYLNNKDLGFRKDNVLLVSIPFYDEDTCETLRNRWLQHSSIQNVSFSSGPPISTFNIISAYHVRQGDGLAKYFLRSKPVDHSYQELFDIPLLAGRFFKSHFESDSKSRTVVNRTLIHQAGFESPEEAVGEKIKYHKMDWEIIGVVEDFHCYSLHQPIMPLAFFNGESHLYREADILVRPDNIQETVDYIKKSWTEIYPDYLFDFRFQDEFISAWYDNENKIFKLVQIASFMAILIGCLGLLGLVSYMVLQRTKEIGIRKTLGASSCNMIFYLSGGLIRRVLLANVFAWPIAYFGMRMWLQTFAYRIALGMELFLIAGLVSLIISFFVIGFHVMKAARANPVESLRYE